MLNSKEARANRFGVSHRFGVANMQFNNKNQTIAVFGLAAILFALVYDISFNGLGVFTTGRLALAVLIVLSGIRGSRLFYQFFFRKKNIGFLIVFVFVLLYSLILTRLSDHWENVMLSRSFWFLVYCIFTPFLIVSILGGNLKNFLLAYFVSACAQSVFVYISIYSPGYRNWMVANIELGGNIDLITSFRSFGFSGAGGATLSLQLALGFISGLLYFDSSAQKKSIIKIFLVFFGLSLIFISQIFVGRTGLLVCLASVVFFALTNFKLKMPRLSSLLAVPLIGFVLGFFVYNFYQNFSSNSDYDFGAAFDWAGSVFMADDKGDETFDVLILQLKNTPTLGYFDAVFGTGKISNFAGSNYSGSDSGYVQSFFALGIVVSSLFYVTVFYFLVTMLSAAKNLPRLTGWFLIGVCFILELKEPFIYKYSMVQFLVLIMAFNSPWIVCKLRVRGGVND